jgi:hypothetical protein
MGTVTSIDAYRRDERQVRAAMRRHPSNRNTVTLTPKGERLLRNTYTTLVLTAATAGFVLLMGIVGYIETL